MRAGRSRWFDEGALERIERIGGAPLREEIVGIFVSLAPGRIEALRHAARERDRPALRASLHGLVSTAANVGGLELHRLALEGQAQALEAPWPELEQLVDSTGHAMERLVAKLGEDGA